MAAPPCGRGRERERASCEWPRDLLSPFMCDALALPPYLNTHSSPPPFTSTYWSWIYGTWTYEGPCTINSARRYNVYKQQMRWKSRSVHNHTICAYIMFREQAISMNTSAPLSHCGAHPTRVCQQVKSMERMKKMRYGYRGMVVGGVECGGQTLCIRAISCARRSS